MKLHSAPSLAMAVTLVAAAAAADTPPSVWEPASDPAAAEAYELHAHVAARLAGNRTGRVELDEIELRAVLPMLQRAGAEKSRYPLLRFDLGNVYEGLGNHRRAAEIFRGAIADFPDHPIVERAWLYLAMACGHIGDHACERSSYVQVLRIETEDLHRATPTLNLAETQMHLGDLKEAVEGYREALRIAGRTPSRDTAPLATWGLAVALDRAGDRAAAEKEARFALEIERSMGGNVSLLRSKNVFFVPEWELHWYEGLGAIALARAATSTRDALVSWRAAEKSFGAYVAMATKDDRWLPLAKVRLAQVKVDRERVEKAAPRDAAPRAAPSIDVSL